MTWWHRLDKWVEEWIRHPEYGDPYVRPIPAFIVLILVPFLIAAGIFLLCEWLWSLLLPLLRSVFW